MEQQWKATERFLQFTLRLNNVSLLPERFSLVVDTLMGTITLVDWQNAQFLHVIEVVDDERFEVLLTLLRRWPSFVPYERLLPHLGIQLTDQESEALERVRTSGKANESDEEQAQDKLAREQLQPVLQTLRDLLEDCRHALHSFGIDIATVIDYGPLLILSHEVGMPQVEESARR